MWKGFDSRGERYKNKQSRDEMGNKCRENILNGKNGREVK